MEKNFDCYECKYRREIPGDAHSSCHHPSVEAGDSDKLNIVGNSHGIKKGWFYFPVNFDPVWLENCDGFEKNS